LPLDQLLYSFSSTSSSISTGGNDLFNNIIVIVTVFLPTVLSSTYFQSDSLKDSMKSRYNQELKLTATKLKKHMDANSKLSTDELVFSVLHTYNCSTVTAFRKCAGLMIPPWLTYSQYMCFIDKKDIKAMDEFWRVSIHHLIAYLA
jgi:hypothetical protein